MSRLQYLLVLAACVLVTLPLELVLGARVYRQARRLVRALLPVVAVFVAWDLLGIARGYWSYSARLTTGASIGPLPIEELAFFVVIPICALLAYEAVGTLLSRSRSAAPIGGQHRGQDA